MLNDLATLSAGLVILALTSILFWSSLPRATGPRWFIGTFYETAIALIVTCGLVLGSGVLIAGILSVAGVQ